MDQTQGRVRRRNYLVNPRFQWKYALAVTTGVLILASLISVFVFGAMMQQARVRMLNPGVPYTWQHATMLVCTALAFACVVGLALSIWSILVTHRICGPMYVMERCMRELGAGRFPHCRPLRKKDEFKDVYKVLQDTVNALKERRQSELIALDDALSSVRSVASSGDQACRAALSDAAAKLQALREDFAEHLEAECSVGPKDDAPVKSPSSEPVLAGLSV